MSVIIDEMYIYVQCIYKTNEDFIMIGIEIDIDTLYSVKILVFNTLVCISVNIL